jgi:hypothetical protein
MKRNLIIHTDHLIVELRELRWAWLIHRTREISNAHRIFWENPSESSHIVDQEQSERITLIWILGTEITHMLTLH